LEPVLQSADYLVSVAGLAFEVLEYDVLEPSLGERAFAPAVTAVGMERRSGEPGFSLGGRTSWSGTAVRGREIHAVTNPIRYDISDILIL
jgi:hypothetical protein